MHVSFFFRELRSNVSALLKLDVQTFFPFLQNVICGGMGHYPVSNQFMIGDYVMPGTVLVQQQGQQPLKKQDIS